MDPRCVRSSLSPEGRLTPSPAADDLHAYVEGDIIECMANSDNMVAHGLGTSEQGGISTFVEMLSYRHLPAEKLLVSHDDVWSKAEYGYARLYNVRSRSTTVQESTS